MNQNDHFFANVPPLADFAASTDSSRHCDLPHDWYVVITDIEGSTKAITEGRYKDVNAAGVATIAAVINIDRTIDIPYIFGGDGATFAIPPSLFEKVKKALFDTKTMMKKNFSLGLRVAIIPVAHLQKSHFHTRVTKWRLSQHILQTSLSGRGWDEAEKLCKTPTVTAFHLEAMPINHQLPPADYSGLECRWKPIPTKAWRHVVLLVVCTLRDPQQHAAVYQDIIGMIRPDRAEYRLHKDQLVMATRLGEVRHEGKIHSRGLTSRWFRTLSALGMARLGQYLMQTGKRFAGHDWSRYKDELIDNTDFRKFDGVLRMVVDVSEDQFHSIDGALSQLHREGKICYGLHTSTTALMTCLIASYSGKHAHFLDGGDGGYALAARQLKSQLKTLNESASHPEPSLGPS